MPEITTLLWDVGGVLLTNGWDRPARRRAAEVFELEWDEFQDRHDLASLELETARITLDQYLDRTVFYRPRAFSRADFRSFMFAQSRPHPETLALATALARTQRYLMATLNNESLELNRYRLETFGLRRIFTLFLSSCFVGVRKPNEAIFRLALDVTQREPAECFYIDDRAFNVEFAGSLGIRTIRFHDREQLEREMRDSGIQLP